MKISLEYKINRATFLFSEPFYIVSLFIPLTYLVVFLLIPLAIPLTELLKANPITIANYVFQNPRYISLNPIGSLIEVKNVVFGGRNITIAVLKGVSFGSIINSFIVATISTLITTAIGIAIALILSLYDFPGKSILRNLAIVPLFAAPFASGYVVKKFFDWRYGLLSYVINDVIGIPLRIGFESFAGVILSEVLSLYVIVYLNVSAAINSIDYTLIEQALNLGSSFRKILKDIIIPLSMPGIAAGASLTFILSIEDIANPIIFKEDRLIAYEIFRSFQDPTTGSRSPGALFMTILIILISLGVFIGIRRYVSYKRYAAITRGFKPLKPLKLSRKGIALVYLFILPFLLFASIPQIGVFILAFSTRWYEPLPEGFTLENFAAFVDDKIVFTAIRNSIVYSLTALAIIAFMSILIAYSSARIKGSLSYFLDTLATIPIAVPGIAIASGFFLLFTSPPFRGTLFDPVLFSPGTAITIAYTVRRLPFMVRAVYAGIQQTAVELEEVALNLGASRFKAFTSAVLPLMALHILGGTLVAFVYCLSETSVGVMLGGLKGVSVGHAAPITFIMQDYLETLYGTQIVGALGAILIILQVIATVTSSAILRGYVVIGVR